MVTPRLRRLVLGSLALVAIYLYTAYGPPSASFREIAESAGAGISSLTNGESGGQRILGSLGARKDDVRALRRISKRFDQLYPADRWRPARGYNNRTLGQLADCMDQGTCRDGQDKVIILASFHFGSALQGAVSGEDIWANSTIEAFRHHGYSLLFTYSAMETLLIYQAIPNLVPIILWESQDLQNCLNRNDTNYQDLEEDWSSGDWQSGKKGCIRRDGFEEGIPVWKSFMFHFWNDNRSPLGHQWTLSPIDFAAIDGKEANNFIGYSIEGRCRSYPLPEHRHYRALALGKKAQYFDPTWKDMSWPDLLPKLVASMPPIMNASGVEEAFSIVATADGPEDLFGQGVVNLGPQKQSRWYEILASSKVLLGVGNPFLSPSPYDALCFGVPFINPVFYKHHKTDRTKWHTQHNELKWIDPPHVYHVLRGDAEGLEDAMRAALDNPIDRFIPEGMRLDVVRQKHKALVEGDWKAQAELVVSGMQAKGQVFEYLL